MERKQLGPIQVVEEKVRELRGREKWGGEYLRAPRVYRELLEGFSEILVPLGKLAEVRSGVRTGWNAFFYLKLLPQRPICPLCGTIHPEALTEGEEKVFWERGQALPPGSLVAVESPLGWKGYLEGGTLHPIYKEMAEIPGVPPLRLFRPLSLEENPHARAYVSWTEGTGRASAGKERFWWRPPYLLGPPIVVPASVYGGYRFLPNPRGFTIDRRLYGVYPTISPERLLKSLDTPIAKLSLEVSVRGNLGGGLADFSVHEYATTLIPHPDHLDRFPKDLLEEAQRALEGLIQERIRRSKGVPRSKKEARWDLAKPLWAWDTPLL